MGLRLVFNVRPWLLLIPDAKPSALITTDRGNKY